ncbi:MAG TPA: hypothetical protein VMV03_09915 [Spirochaetia bacterium]|nr:hypothetical protein [Spirochaetia bacterium]
MSDMVLASLAQLVAQLPTLLTLLAGIVVFLVMMRRSPLAFILAAVSFGALLVASVGQVFATNLLIGKRTEAGWSVSSLATMLSVAAVLFAIFRAGAFGMLIAAVLVGRKEKP